MTASSSVARQLATSVPSKPATAAPLQDFGAILGQWEKQIKIVSAYYTSRFNLCEADRYDLEQACRIALWRAVAHRNLSPDTYEKYLRCVLRNTIHTTLKSLVPDPGRYAFVDELDDDDDETGEHDDHALAIPTMDTSHELVIDINRFLSRLEPGLCRLCNMVYHQGLSQKEAALALGVSQPRVCQLHDLLIQHVKQELAAYRM